MISRKTFSVTAFAVLMICIVNACKKGDGSTVVAASTSTSSTAIATVSNTFGPNINLTVLENYAAQPIPAYIRHDNSGTDPITDAGATLGRVLFYDKNLSINNTVACASCHKQNMAFGDSVVQSNGVNGGLTTRHSMRLVNARFAQEIRFFWDKRATTLEDQTTQPIQNHNEMGYSGLNGDPDISVLIAKLQGIGYYQQLFKFVYGDATITQLRMQTALSQFIRSIQSFDAKFDTGMAATNNLAATFPNFTAQENAGKTLFLTPPSPPGVAVMGAGCQGCHRAPEFDVDPNAHNNGIIGVAGTTTLIDVTNINPPSLRNLLDPNGKVNGLYMHNGCFTNLSDVINHYNQIIVDPLNTNLDARLHNGAQGQSLRLSQAQKDAIVAFLATLSGKDVYANKKWSNPFLSN